MNEEMQMMINAIIEEMGRMEERINTKFERVDTRLDKIEQCLESMQHEINACWILNLRPFVDIYSIKMLQKSCILPSDVLY